jgi:hypothetical protein
LSCRASGRRCLANSRPLRWPATTRPWLTANLHLSAWPEERHGAPPAWDNVFYDSPGLGYVVATHQLIRRHLSGTVFTYYRALHDVAPAEGRRLLLETPREAWAEGILAELERVHPDIRR